MSNHSDPSSSITVLIGVVGTILLVATVVGLEAVYYNTERVEFERKVVAEAPEELRSIRADQLKNLNAYEWVNRASGTVRIPIDRAMQLVVQEANARTAPAPNGSTAP